MLFLEISWTDTLPPWDGRALLKEKFLMIMETIVQKDNSLMQKEKELLLMECVLTQKALPQLPNPQAPMPKANLQLHIQQDLMLKVRAHRLVVSQIVTPAALMLTQKV